MHSKVSNIMDIRQTVKKPYITCHTLLNIITLKLPKQMAKLSKQEEHYYGVICETDSDITITLVTLHNVLSTHYLNSVNGMATWGNS